MSTLFLHLWLLEIDWPLTFVAVVLPILALVVVLFVIFVGRKKRQSAPKKSGQVVCQKCGFKSATYFQTCPVCTFDKKSGAFADPTKEVVSQPTKGLCGYCHGEIEVGVFKCRHCGEWLDPGWRRYVERPMLAQIRTGAVATFIAVLLCIEIFFQIVAAISRH
jgi:hypothetical protein